MDLWILDNFLRELVDSFVGCWNRMAEMSDEVNLERLRRKIKVSIDGAVIITNIAQICWCYKQIILRKRSKNRIVQTYTSEMFAICSLFMSK